MKTELLLEKLISAKTALTAAETDLERALAEISVAPRAQKVTVSEVVADAFDKLREARKEIAALETLVREEEPEPTTK
jgi:hypothetical protein